MPEPGFKNPDTRRLALARSHSKQRANGIIQRLARGPFTPGDLARIRAAVDAAGRLDEDGHPLAGAA